MSTRIVAAGSSTLPVPVRRPPRGAAALLLALLALPGCGRGTEAAPAAELGRAGVRAGPTAAQAELLLLALETASALPAAPHAKTKARLQADVVEACLALDAPERALLACERIEGWRRGKAYADVARHFARTGRREAALRCIASARDVEEREARAAVEEPTAQGWQRDRIRAGVAAAYLSLGEAEAAAACAEGLADAEQAVVAGARAGLLAAESFDAELGRLDAELATGNFDRARAALEALVVLHGRFHGDAGRAARIDNGLEAGFRSVPSMVKIEVLARLAEAALLRSDLAEAARRIDAAQAALDGTAWKPEHSLPQRARLAVLRHRAGLHARARAELDAALGTFDRERAAIVDIDRAGALRPIAEAYAALGETGAAEALYLRVIEEGTVNPNSRPRAEDLVATCLALAVHGPEQGHELRAALRRVADGLGDPW